MQVKVYDIGGVTEAEFVISGLTLIAGKNAAGKTTIARSVASLLCGTVLPIAGSTKGHAIELVRNGKKLGFASLGTEGGDAKLSYPACEMKTDGTPPRASVVAVGLADLFSMPVKERSATLQRILKTTPTREEFDTKLSELGMEQAALDTLWKEIDRLGWDGSAGEAANGATKKKGAWEQITGKKWGSVAGAQWLPVGQDVSLTVHSREKLIEDVNAAKALLEKAIGSAALGGAELEQAKALAETVEVKRAALTAVEDEGITAARLMMEAQKRRDEMPSADMVSGTPCPHCKTPLVHRIDHNTKLPRLELVVEIDAGEQKKRRRAIAEADGEVGRLQGAHAESRKAWLATLAALSDAERAEKLVAEAADKTGSADEVGAARAALTEATKILADYEKWTTASAIHADITLKLAIAEALGDAGLRKTKLEQVLHLFNDSGLRELSEAAGWSPLVIANDLSISYGGRRFELLSASEQWRARALIQVAFARIEKGSMVVLDAADILDQRGRNGLIKMLSTVRMTALIIMTFAKADKVPDMERFGGASYWIEEGKLQPLSEALDALQVAA
jgi:hypothetical protein